MAVAAGAFDMRDDDVLLAHAENLGEVLAQPEDALRVRPDLELVAFQRASAHDGPIEACAMAGFV